MRKKKAEPFLILPLHFEFFRMRLLGGYSSKHTSAEGDSAPVAGATGWILVAISLVLLVLLNLEEGT